MVVPLPNICKNLSGPIRSQTVKDKNRLSGPSAQVDRQIFSYRVTFIQEFRNISFVYTVYILIYSKRAVSQKV